MPAVSWSTCPNDCRRHFFLSTSFSLDSVDSVGVCVCVCVWPIFSGKTVDEFRMCSQDNCAKPPPIPSDETTSSPGLSGNGQGTGTWQQRQNAWAGTGTGTWQQGQSTWSGPWQQGQSTWSGPWQQGQHAPGNKPPPSVRIASANAVEAIVADYFQYQDPDSYLVNASLLGQGFRPDAGNATAYQLSFVMSFPSLDYAMFEENEGLLDQFAADFRYEIAQEGRG